MSDSKTQQIRSGPHPLSLHVASSTQNWTAAAAAFPLFQLGGLQIHPDLKQQAEDLRQNIADADLEQLQLRIMTKAQNRLSHMLAGIRAYQHHPYTRQTTPMPLFNKIGTTEVRDYGRDLVDDAPVVLAVPSLINPAYILDLAENHSFMRNLSEQGIHPYLLDWTTPQSEELAFGLEDYIIKRLLPVIRELHRHHNKKIHLLGYCMGGNLALAAAQILQPENMIEGLTLIATPWDFHVDQPAHLPALTTNFLAKDIFNSGLSSIPANIMQLFFFSLDPTLSDRKFRKFSTQIPTASKARNFVAIEDWVNDGSPLSPQVAIDCLRNWYQENQPHNKCWRIADQIIDPSCLDLSGHIITPKTDRIVPPASAKALQKILPNFTHTVASGGHVTMIAGNSSKTTLWHKIASYLK
ncbi:MAG: alpha/beta fold hydrolase [Emcibacter sp.]|nr:alpha/beta fold hydrolase [Emcibacter sp.]